MASVTSRWHRERPPQPGETTCEHGRVPLASHGQGKQWQTRWIDDTGKQCAANYAKKADADARKTQIEADQLRGVYRNLDAGKQTLKSYAEDWLASRNGLAPSSRSRYISYLNNHVNDSLGAMQLRKIRPSVVNNWMAGLAVSDNTKRAALAVVSMVMNAAVEDEILDKNPCRATVVDPPKVYRPEVHPWVSQQVRAVRDELPAHLQILVELMAGIGLRQGEALGLSPSDVDFLRGDVYVQRQLTRAPGTFLFRPPKHGRARHVPLRPAVRDALAAHLARFPATEVTLPWDKPDSDESRTVALVVTDPQRRPIYGQRLNEETWYPALRRAGVKRGVRVDGCHALRHTFASVLLANGVSLPEVAAYLGHSSITITANTYSHVIPRLGEQITWRGMAAIDDLLLGHPPMTDDASPGVVR
jgi:integrase